MLKKLALRLRPGINEMENPGERASHLVLTMNLLWMVPLGIISIGWLLWRTDIDVFRENAIELLLVGGFIMVVHRQPFMLRLGLGGGTNYQLQLSGSMSGLIIWSTLLLYGETVIWLAIIVGVMSAAWDHWAQTRYGVNQFWVHIFTMVQAISWEAFTYLCAAAAYRGLGGTFPLTTLNDWLPVMVAIIVEMLLTGLFALPVITNLNSLLGIKNSIGTMATFILSAVVLMLPINPFAVVLPVAHEQVGVELFFVLLMGAVLVNILAHYMSRINAKSLQRSNELDQLERLGEAIIQAPPDLESLEAILRERAGRMFQEDRLEINLFEHFKMRFPAEHPTADDAVWKQMSESPDPHIVLPKVVLPGTRVPFGDAIVDKIMAVTPGEESQECLGGVYLLRHYQRGKTLESLAAVQSLASQIAAAIYRIQAQAETLAAEMMKQELAFAGQVQSKFLPPGLPIIEGWQLAMTLDPARQTSGDFYDVIGLPDGKLAVIVADVADKGTGAALFMALSRTLLRTYAREYPLEPGKVLAIANDRIDEDTASNQFVTLFYGVLEPTTGKMTYANAGHNPAFLFSNGDVLALKRTGIPLGMMTGRSWKTEEIELAPGAILVAYTDGVTEAQNTDDELYGEERLMEIIRANQNQPADIIQTAIVDSVHQFVGEAPQFDDITLMVLARDD